MRRVPTNQEADRVFRGYRYREGDLFEVWSTSVPSSVAEALAYIDWVERHFPGYPVEFLEGRNEEGSYEPIQWELLDERTGKRTPFVPSILRTN
ncbi:hypothetical protein SEA_HARAMBE_58 [Gordonia phage Harambe]|uniref:Uncharacterized protein n=4 Tax=Woesvirus woes TaxID=1982751 RepID=A0A514A633_9CAUD|nr:hypothetical protein SEA_HARAMBE_58 [Gordonia phage Harambe]QAX95419.1 hypothetical protein SEA_NEOEVIE_58 [Gordonia phage Neoevie]QDF16917.1 hypothetical protein SEA_TEAL_58 [Gordonia phage Teal]QDH48703.1 hypothetical protein SEA_NEWT_59 [Gordonia phage Newt]UYL87229.1 hypothetical protein SEA_MINOS_59 [Gordonia phage Minos]